MSDTPLPHVPHAGPLLGPGPLLEERLDRVTDELAGEFSGNFTRETISRFVVECHDIVTSLLMPPVRPGEPPSPRTITRVRGLTRRFALERLEALTGDETLSGAGPSAGNEAVPPTGGPRCGSPAYRTPDAPRWLRR